nr:alpha/beta hydrolase [Rhodospirillales bacterium]
TVGLDCFTQQLKALIHGGDLRQELQKIDCPTLVLCGEEDRLLPVEQSREISRGIRQSKLVTLKGAAHLLPMERPDTVSELMQQWLTGTLPMDGTELTI